MFDQKVSKIIVTFATVNNTTLHSPWISIYLSIKRCFAKKRIPYRIFNFHYSLYSILISYGRNGIPVSCKIFIEVCIDRFCAKKKKKKNNGGK